MIKKVSTEQIAYSVINVMLLVLIYFMLANNWNAQFAEYIAPGITQCHQNNNCCDYVTCLFSEKDNP
jgi:hypothetical protein